MVPITQKSVVTFLTVVMGETMGLMIRYFRYWLFLLAVLISTFAAAKPQYINPIPLAQLINTPVSKVNEQTFELPVITWGADINTIYANGSQSITSSNSLFSSYGLKFRLNRNDKFSDQLTNYLSGKTPYLRGTLGMVNAASDLLASNPSVTPIIIHQLSWSSGGDALVVKPSVRTVADLKGKTIALQAYGPHVDYMGAVLKDAGLTPDDVTIKWLPDLTGTNNSPASALYENDVDAVFVILPDALALTSGGSVGTGSEDSVKGAKILMSTKTANRVIADVYAVRADYFNSHRSDVMNFVKALNSATDEVKVLFNNANAQNAKLTPLLSYSADLLLDSPDAIEDIKGLYADAEHLDINANKQLFSDMAYPRNITKVSNEIQTTLKRLSLTSASTLPQLANWDFTQLGADIEFNNKSRFNSERVASVVAKKQQQNSLADGELFSFEVAFQPNQNSFNSSLYQTEFKRVIELASTYGGAVITVEGHSDPLKYLRSKKKGETGVVLNRIKQSNRNISLSRAQSVKQSVLTFATDQGIALDASQFALVGHGFGNPKTGMCGNEPCAPATESDWRSNMRVVFRIIQLEAESDVFQPL